MTNPRPRDDDAFLRAFFACELPAADFDHRAHLRLAWLMLKQHDFDEALERICDGIQRFAAHLGATDKYNRTMSEAIVRLMVKGGAGPLSPSWDEFATANPRLFSDLRGILSQHYSPERLASAEARRTFLPPDRSPLTS